MKLDFLGNSNLSNCPCKNQSEMTDNHLVTAGTNCIGNFEKSRDLSGKREKWDTKLCFSLLWLSKCP